MVRTGRRTAAPARRRGPLLVGGAVALLVAGAAIAMLALRADGDGAPNAPPAFGDVHGLAVDAQDARRIFVATHHGLVVREPDGAWAKRGPEDDLMGFTAHPTDAQVFWASGHPKNATADRYNLGVRKTTDAGRTWSDLALPGVDLHAMTTSPADPDHVWGVAGGVLQRSTDGGATWTRLGPAPAQTRAIAADPRDAEALYAIGAGGVQRSTDGGATWSLWSAQPGHALAWARDATRAYLATGDAVLVTTDDGATWTRSGAIDARGTIAFVAVAPTDARIAYAATYQGGVHKTEDGGATWSVVKGDD